MTDNSKKDGGPVFPQTELDKILYTGGGLNMRDYIAIQAMQGFLANGNIEGSIRIDGDEMTLPEASYKAADAMLKEREKFYG